MDAKWTPGPLTVRKAAAYSDCGIISDGMYVVGETFADIRKANENAKHEALANATLWASAPDLYAALEAACEYENREAFYEERLVAPWYEDAVNALLNARGEA